MSYALKKGDRVRSIDCPDSDMHLSLWDPTSFWGLPVGTEFMVVLDSDIDEYDAELQHPIETDHNSNFSKSVLEKLDPFVEMVKLKLAEHEAGVKTGG